MIKNIQRISMEAMWSKHFRGIADEGFYGYYFYFYYQPKTPGGAAS
ncbi:MAG TPA: hypothetical protein PLQ76_09160 [bacterium]|nr:hypothetical protein [bacterium]